MPTISDRSTHHIIPLIDQRHGMQIPSIAPHSMAANGLLEDQLGRSLQDLRISVTDRCNFRCTLGTGLSLSLQELVQGCSDELNLPLEVRRSLEFPTRD